MADHFPFLPPSAVPEPPRVGQASLWLLLDCSKEFLTIQKVWGDLPKEQQDKVVSAIDLSSEWMDAAKKSLSNNTLEHFSTAWEVEENACQSRVELIPVNQERQSWVIAHCHLVNIDRLGRDEHIQMMSLPILSSVNRRIGQTIKSLKASIFLLNKADKPTTRCYFNELADANISKIECLVDDVKIFNSLTDRDSLSVKKQFSIAAILEDIEISRQGLLSQKAINLKIDKGNIDDFYFIGDADYYMLLLNKLFDLLFSWNERGRILTLGRVEKNTDNKHVLVLNILSHCVKLPVGVDINEIDKLLNGLQQNTKQTQVLPLLDLMICRQIIQSLSGSIGISQSSFSDINVTVHLPVQVE
ncbi:MAG: hypothetical protein OXE99_09220 [Cellvibrionales bacterium]|nr:hypothetical protein [Cellvibrionales bacterium]